MKTILNKYAVMLAVLFTLGSDKATSREVIPESSGGIKGTVKSEKGDAIPFCNLFIPGAGKGTTSDENGNFLIKPLEAGQYDLKASSMGFGSIILRGINVKPGEIAEVNFILPEVKDTLDVILIEKKFIEPVVDKRYSTIHTIPPEILEYMPSEPGDLGNLVVNVCSSCGNDAQGNLVMRGSRPGTVQYIVDGEKLHGSTSVPSMAIMQVTVLSGGIPAEYGDVTGGIVIVNTKDYRSGMFFKKTMEREVRERLKEKLSEEEKSKREEELRKKGIRIEELEE